MIKEIINIGDTGQEVVDKLANNFTMAIDMDGLYSVQPLGGGLSDQANIQAAIDAAALVNTTVKLSSGSWYITGQVLLKSNVSIIIDRQAVFNFPSGYAGKMWSNNGALLAHCYVRGGKYVGFNEANPQWDCIDLLGTNYLTAYVVDCHFSDMWIQNARRAVSINKIGQGWVDGNKFSNLFVWNCVYGVYADRVLLSGGGIDNNTFSDLMIQASTITLCGLHLNVGVAYWTFTNVLLIDFIEGQVPFIFGALTENIIFHGTIPGPLPARHDPVINLGLENLVMTNHTFEIAKKMVIKQISGSLTDNTPTDAEIDTAIGLTAVAAGAGYQVIIKDTTGTGLLYKVESDGTNWFYSVMTKAI